VQLKKRFAGEMADNQSLPARRPRRAAAWAQTLGPCMESPRFATESDFGAIVKLIDVEVPQTCNVSAAQPAFRRHSLEVPYRAKVRP
jgi:hypothetical protein